MQSGLLLLHPGLLQAYMPHPRLVLLHPGLLHVYMLHPSLLLLCC
jgi:hypothetical protein